MIYCNWYGSQPEGTITTQRTFSIVKRKVYIRKKADLNGIKKALKNFAECFEREGITKSVEERWNDLEYQLQHIMNTFIPYRTTRSRHNLPWFNRSLKCLVKAKQWLYNKAKKSGHATDWSKFCAARKHLNSRLKTARNTYVSEYLTEALANNPKKCQMRFICSAVSSWSKLHLFHT